MMYQETIAIIKAIVGNERLYLGKAIQVTPKPDPTYIWAVAVSPENELWVMDSYQEWFELKEDEYRIVQLVYLKMKDVQRNYKQPVHISKPLEQELQRLQQASQR